MMHVFFIVEFRKYPRMSLKSKPRLVNICICTSYQSLGDFAPVVESFGGRLLCTTFEKPRFRCWNKKIVELSDHNWKNELSFAHNFEFYQ